MFNITGVNAEDYFSVILEFLEEANLDVGVIAGQYARRVKVVQQLSAEFKIQPTVKLLHPVTDACRLFRYIQLIVKTLCHVCSSPDNLIRVYTAPGCICNKLRVFFSNRIPGQIESTVHFRYYQAYRSQPTVFRGCNAQDSNGNCLLFYHVVYRQCVCLEHHRVGTD